MPLPEHDLSRLDEVRGEASAPQPAARTLVVVLNFNGIADTLACLDSLRAQTCPGVTALVVDNGSRADDLGRIAARFPEVEVIALGENRGWAGGNNVGLRLGLERDFVNICLLNNDTVLRPDAFAELLAAAEAIGVPCLLHPGIHYFDDPSRPQLFPDPPAALDAAARRLFEDHNIVEINWAYGACLMVPAALVRHVGLLDERFFLQLEEHDYYMRAAARGIRSYCARRARILHKESISFGGRVTPDKTYYQVRNTLLLAEKHLSRPAEALWALRRMLWMLHRQATTVRPDGGSRLGLLRWLCSADEFARATRQGVRHYLFRRFGARPVPPPAARPVVPGAIP